MTFTAEDYRMMAYAARRGAERPGLSGEGVIELGPTNLRIRFSSSTYIARGAGIVASCTAGPALAVKAWATKAVAAAAALEEAK